MQKTVLTNKILAKTAQMNQKVFINDLLVSPIKVTTNISGRLGELAFIGNKENYPILARLIDHLEVLMNIAVIYHTSNKLSPDRITRINTWEFSLYPSDKPLSLDEFNILLEATETMARIRRENVHALISSIPVSYCNEVLNICLYVQCGSNSVVTTFAKTKSSSIDPVYPNYRNYNRYVADVPQSYGNDDGGGQFCMHNCTNEDLNGISNFPIILCNIKNGASFFAITDICLDHKSQRASALFQKFITANLGNSLLPIQYTYIVTSNHVDCSFVPFFEEQATTHVDPFDNQSISFSEWLFGSYKKIEPSSQSQYGSIKKNKYPSMKVTVDGAVFVYNPPFGGGYRVRALAEKQVGVFKGDGANLINHSNQEYLNRILVRMPSVKTYAEVD